MLIASTRQDVCCGWLQFRFSNTGATSKLRFPSETDSDRHAHASDLSAPQTSWHGHRVISRSSVAHQRVVAAGRRVHSKCVIQCTMDTPGKDGGFHIVKRKSKSRIKSMSPTLQQVRWVPNAFADRCYHCSSSFNMLTNRKHHCRYVVLEADINCFLATEYLTPLCCAGTAVTSSATNAAPTR